MIEVIGELGVNHNGSMDTARWLIDAAKAAGVDTVKTQLWNTERVYPRERWEEMKRLELSIEQIAELKAHAEQQDLRFLCTPDDVRDLVALVSIGVDRIKIGSSNLRNHALLQHAAACRKPIILSTGAATFDEVMEAGSYDYSELVVMHCVSAYPAKFDELNLSVISRYADAFPLDGVGFSDHSEPSLQALPALVALGLGARTFERHLTLDRCALGPDHAASLSPGEMELYVWDLRNAAQALGDGNKRVMPCEEANRREYDRFLAQQAAAVC